MERKSKKKLKIPYYETLTGDVRNRYDEKIRQCDGIDPYEIKEQDLSKDTKDFPEITLLDIGNYFVHSTSSFTKKSFKAYKSMESYKYFQSGFVLNMGSKKNKNVAIIRGKVSIRIRGGSLITYVCTPGGEVTQKRKLYRFRHFFHTFLRTVGDGGV